MTTESKIELVRQATRTLRPLRKWAQQCHGASVTLVRAGIGTRVARGFCEGVGGQHSWVVVGYDCYDPKALIIDPTLWSYRDDVKGVFVGTPTKYGHTPHGTGSIWDWGKPITDGGPTVRLTPKTPLSIMAREFLGFIEPLDRAGWGRLAGAPIGGWPAAEIIAAIDDTKQLSALVPVDRLGMLTDRNPGGLYLK